MKELFAFDIYKLIQEAQILLGGKIDAIYQIGSKDLYLQIYLKDQPKQLLRIVSGKCLYLTKTRPEFPENIQRFCAYLRKYITNARIKAIEQIDYERIIKFVLETKDATYELLVELFGKGNFILVKDDRIISVAEEQIWADRILKSGESYKYPQKADTRVIFEKQKEKGSSITMALLDEQLSAEVLQLQKRVSPKTKEIQKIKTIIEKQSEQLRKTLKEAEENKRKGELIYEQYQELQSLLSVIKEAKGRSLDEIKKILKSSKLFKELREKEGTLVVNLP